MDIFYPIQVIADFVIYSIFGLTKNTIIAGVLNFFIYDSIKIFLLLAVIIFIVSFLRSYLPPEKTRKFLTNKYQIVGNILASLIGIVTPFCSCSSIPLFIGFVGAGIPLGVTFAFLISSPLVNESSLYLFPAMFGMKVTIIYNIVGILIAMIGGFLIQKLGMEKYIKPELLKFKSRVQVEQENGGTPLPLTELLKYFWNDGMAITKSVFPYVLLGVGIGALIHGFVPASFVVKYLSNKSWWAVPLATLLGAPLYANSVSVIPVMEALVQKGVPLGTALSFMTAIVTVSIPESMILKKVMKWQLLAAFFGVTIMGIVIMGWIFNAVL